jgi:uncharacterized membrane-anchored protein
MSRLRWLVVVVAAQAAVLLAWAGYHEWNRATAATVLLETVPVDPRDLLRGDYMILSYKISRVPKPAETSADPSRPREIWVTLRQSGRFHEVAATSWTAPRQTDGSLVTVRGRTHGPGNGGTLSVVYDIEKFFVPEGRGEPEFSEMVVEATVSARRRLGIKRLLLDGQPYPK